jgi:hypothetical protein
MYLSENNGVCMRPGCGKSRLALELVLHNPRASPSCFTTLLRIMSFPPTILRTVFPPEPKKDPPILPLRITWPSQGTAPVQVQNLPGKIRKPPGEVTRLSRGGYSLQKVLGWDPERYKKILVSCLKIVNAA